MEISSIGTQTTVRIIPIDGWATRTINLHKNSTVFGAQNDGWESLFAHQCHQQLLCVVNKEQTAKRKEKNTTERNKKVYVMCIIGYMRNTKHTFAFLNCSVVWPVVVVVERLSFLGEVSSPALCKGMREYALCCECYTSSRMKQYQETVKESKTSISMTALVMLNNNPLLYSSFSAASWVRTFGSMLLLPRFFFSR